MGKGGGGGSYTPNPTYGTNGSASVPVSNLDALASTKVNPVQAAPAPVDPLFTTSINKYTPDQTISAMNNKQIMSDPNNRIALMVAYRNSQLHPAKTPYAAPAMPDRFLTAPVPVTKTDPTSVPYKATQTAPFLPAGGFTNGNLPNAGANFPAGFVPRPSPFTR